MVTTNTSNQFDDDKIVPRKSGTPKAQKHGPIEEVIKGKVYVVKGETSMNMGMFMPKMVFSRSMTILRQKSNKNDDDTYELTLVNSIRLNKDTLKELDSMGKVTNIVKLASHHGYDDPYYKTRYGKNVCIWEPYGSKYFDGIDPYANKGVCYYKPDKYYKNGDIVEFLDNAVFQNAKFVVIESAKIPDGLLVFDTKVECNANNSDDDDGSSSPKNKKMKLTTQKKIMIAGDSFQNYNGPDEYTNWFGKICMNMLGFFIPYNIGPPWYETMKPQKQELLDICNTTQFDYLFPAHGTPVLEIAYIKYKMTIAKLPQHK